MAPHRKTSGTTISSSNTSKQTAKNTKHIDYSKLQISDVLCPLCRNVLIEPITLPCQHCFCWRCLQGKIMQQEDMGSRGTETCPQCQVRFGGWYRTAKKQRKLLTNQPLWKAIRENFLKTDNPLHPFLLNGVRKRVPTQPVLTELAKAASTTLPPILPTSATSTPHTLLLTVGSHDSNDSSCAEDAIRRECNHFRPIDGHLHEGLYSSSRQQQKGGKSGPRVVVSTAIIRVPTTRANKCGDAGDDVVGPPRGRNSFFSDPRQSAFYLVHRTTTQQKPPPYLIQVKTREEPEDVAMEKSTDFHWSRRIVNVNNEINSQKDNVIYNNKDREVATNSNATTVIMLQQPKQFNTRHNGLIKSAKTVAERSKINTNNKMNKRKEGRIKQKKGGEDRAQRKSARRNVTVATAATKQQSISCQHKDNKCDVDSSSRHAIDEQAAAGGSRKNAAKVVQLQADRQLARELHCLLNGGATRRRTTTAAALNHSHQLLSLGGDNTTTTTTTALVVRKSAAAMRGSGRRRCDHARLPNPKPPSNASNGGVAAVTAGLWRLRTRQRVN